MLAVNGWSLKARTLRDVSEMIAVSCRHLTLRIEFDVAGRFSFCCRHYRRRHHLCYKQ